MKKEKQNNNKIIIAVSVIIIFAIISISFLIIYLNKVLEKEREKHRNYNETFANNSVSVVEDNSVGEVVTNETIIDDPTQVIEKTYGKVEVVWVDIKNNVVANPEKPILGGMEAVVYNRQKSDFDKISKDENWYNYSNRQWANAIDENGSFFVWIPRYAYKVVYYADNAYEKVIGYTDARGMLKVNEDGTLTRILNNNAGLKEVGNHYILHPAFMNDYPSGYRNGGWDDNIAGIWIAKYEVSMELNNENVEVHNENEGNVDLSGNIKLVSKPGLTSWRNISISNAFDNSYKYNRERESHLLKNSEWGAVSYLAYSKYGTNSAIIEVNESRNYLTGGSQTPSEVYNLKKNESCNKNETGIYDMAGGAEEFTAGYINNENITLQQYGEKLIAEARNNKYKTIYNKDISDDGKSKYDMQYANANFVRNALFRGDALFETSNSGYGNTSWDMNSAFFVEQDVPFFIRGGDFSSGRGAGLFSYNASSGQPNAGQGYRIALVCKE